jgi:hypothetical protein
MHRIQSLKRDFGVCLKWRPMTGSAKQSNVRQRTGMDCFVARASRNDGGEAADDFAR